MPKLTCSCGYVHNLSLIPDDGWKTIRDKDYEHFIDAHIKRDGLGQDRGTEGHSFGAREGELTHTIVSKIGLLYECSQCGRLMWEKPGEKKFCIFVPEKGAN